LFSLCSVDSIGNSAIESEAWKDAPAHSEDAFSIVSAVDEDLVSRGLFAAKYNLSRFESVQTCCVVCWLHWYLLGNSHVFCDLPCTDSETCNLFQYNLAVCQWLLVYSIIPIMCDKHQICLITSFLLCCLFNATSEFMLSEYSRILHCGFAVVLPSRLMPVWARRDLCPCISIGSALNFFIRCVVVQIYLAHGLVIRGSYRML
jgi:hypothetical protein